MSQVSDTGKGDDGLSEERAMYRSGAHGSSRRSPEDFL
jgi:hypothetical protein